MSDNRVFQPSAALPTKDDRPNADVVIFDGHCQVCTDQVERLQRWDGQDRFCYLSCHDPRATAEYPDLTQPRLMQEMVVVDRRGQRHGGAAAIRYLSRRIRRLWWLAPLLHFPGSLWLWQLLYVQFARRRYRFGGRADCDSQSCRVHRPLP